MNLFSAIRLHQVSVIPRELWLRLWMLTAGGMWCTSVIIWATLQSDFLLIQFHSMIVFFVIALLLGLGFLLASCLSRFSTITVTIIYAVTIFITGISIGNIFHSLGGVTVFAIVGGMFAMSSIVCHCFHLNPGTGRQLLLMTGCGILLAIAVNSILASSIRVWLCSIVAVLLWGLVTAMERSTLQDYARHLYDGDFITLSRCTILGATTLYLCIINAIAVLFRWIIEIVGSLLMGLNFH
ncbi:Bax inhibitor-1 family protein [Salmonella enterica]|nr:Bax inhibitor-1 family protein [Salmonella enterica]